MPGPKKTSKSPARSGNRGRSRSASRTETRTRSRSRSSGRKPKSVASEVNEIKEVKVVLRRSPARQLLRTTKSPSRTENKESSVIKRSVVSTVYSSASSSSHTSLSASSSAQEQASVTPVRTSSRIASIIEKEKEISSRLREQVRSDVLSSITTPPSKLEPKTESKKPHYEFMGPIGTLLITILAPLMLFYVNLACSKDRCSLQLPAITRRLLVSLLDVEATLIVLAWFFFHVFLAVLPVGRVVEGHSLKSGERLKYRCNGFIALVVSLSLLLVAAYFGCPVSSAVNKLNKLMTSTVVFTFMLSVCLFISSKFVSEKKLASAGNTGNVIYDFFIGRELNPRVGMLDLKFLCALRPGLIALVVLIWILVIKAYEETGSYPPNLVLVAAFQTLYVADRLWCEDSFLSTREIIHDGCGFMLIFGSLSLVPFLYSLQCRFIYASKFSLPWYCLAPIALLHFAGYCIYRLSSSEKNCFRNNPKDPRVSGLETVASKAGKSLVVSGWRGLCHKPHYLGHLIMTLSCSLSAGFASIVPYLCFLHLLICLIHRESRDSRWCREKYGASWDRYCERVKYRIFPFIY